MPSGHHVSRETSKQTVAWGNLTQFELAFRGGAVAPEPTSKARRMGVRTRTLNGVREFTVVSEWLRNVGLDGPDAGLKPRALALTEGRGQRPPASSAALRFT